MIRAGQNVQWDSRNEGGEIRVSSADPTSGGFLSPADVTTDTESSSAIAQRYRLLVELSPDAIAVHEAGVVVYINPAGVRLARVRSKEDMIGRYITDFVHPDSIPEMLERLMNLGEDGAATEPAEALMLLADGSTKPAEIVSVRTEWDGRPAFQVIMRDISTKKAAEAALQYQAALVDHVSDAVIALTADGVIEAWNPAAERVYGISASDAVGQPFHKVVNARFDAPTALAFGGTLDAVHSHASGASLNIRISVTAMGEGFVLLCADMASARQSIERFGTVISELNEAIIVATSEGVIELANPAAFNLLGLSPSDVPGLEIATLPIEFPDDQREDLIARVLQTGVGFTGRRARRTGGGLRWFSVSCHILDVDQDNPTLITSLTDITEQTVDAENQRHRAIHDGLTGLLNRSGLLARLDLASPEPGAVPLVNVHYLDLDRFKMINDSLGHSYGDEVLRIVAQRLLHAAVPGSVVGRIGGDEFVVISPASAPGASISGQAEQLLSAIATDPIEAGAGSVRMTASVGSVGTDLLAEQRSGVDLLRDADIALYYAKQSDRAGAVLFSVPLREKFQYRQQLEQDLRVALDTAGNEAQVRNSYELIYDTATGLPVAVEAHPRWMHPTRGEIALAELMPLAEQSNLVETLGRQVMVEALADLTTAFGYQPGKLTLAVNVSAGQFRDVHLVTGIREAIKRSSVRPADVRLEISETAFSDENGTRRSIVIPRAQLDDLRALGVRIVLDHFGSGYSSLEQLEQLPVNGIKIAASFVNRYSTSHFARTVVESIVGIARSEDLVVIADGVSSADELRAMTDLGCTQAQGPYLHASASAAETARHLR